MFNRTIAKNPSDLDSILDAFERESEESGGASVVAYLPDTDDPAYQRIAVELIRVDLERSWARGSKKRLEAYREITPQLFADPRRLGEIAFEEYRLRKQAGEPVSAAEYEQQYAIDTNVWPTDYDEAIGADGASSLLAEATRGFQTHPPEFPGVGDSFAGFELVEQLGRGAFGVVFRARQADLAARDVVLKVTAARSVEPQRLARLQHTNIVPLYSMHEDAGLLAICMPYFGRQTFADITRGNIPGVEHAGISTVAQRDAQTLAISQLGRADIVVQQNGKPAEKHRAVSPDVATIVDRIAQLAEGLAHAHGRGIVHSDLKPANVLLTDDGVPMLLDFNLSSDASSPYQKATLLVGGTLPYMAPEHLLATLNGGPVPAASDVYSLGVIAFELLTGRRPFQDRAGEFDQTVDRLVADRQGRAPAVRSVNPRVSEGLSSIVARCLAPELQNRYASAGQLAEDLRCYQRDLPLRYAPEPSVRERGGKWLRRNARGVRWAVAASLVALLASLSAMYMARHNRLADLEAATAFSEFEADAQTALLNLHAPGSEPELHSLGRAAAERAVNRFGLLDGNLAANANFLRLAPARQEAARHQGVELLYSLASQANSPNDATPQQENQDQLNGAIRYNDAALSLLPANEGSKALLEQRMKLLTAVGDELGASNARRTSQASRARRARSILRCRGVAGKAQLHGSGAGLGTALQ